MPGKDHGPSIRNDAQYEALRDKGMSREKAARIANSEGASRRGGEATPYEERTRDQLLDKAREVGIEGRSSMTKAELIDALRNH